MNLEAIFSNLGIFSLTSGQLIMLLVGLLILYLAINKKFEPLLLLPDEGYKTKSEEVRTEMTAIAKRISLLVNPKNKKDQPAFRYNEEQKKFQNVTDNNKYQYSDPSLLVQLR